MARENGDHGRILVVDRCTTSKSVSGYVACSARSLNLAHRVVRCAAIFRRLSEAERTCHGPRRADARVTSNRPRKTVARWLLLLTLPLSCAELVVLGLRLPLFAVELAQGIQPSDMAEMLIAQFRGVGIGPAKELAAPRASPQRNSCRVSSDDLQPAFP